MIHTEYRLIYQIRDVRVIKPIGKPYEVQVYNEQIQRASTFHTTANKADAIRFAKDSVWQHGDPLD